MAHTGKAPLHGARDHHANRAKDRQRRPGRRRHRGRSRPDVTGHPTFPRGTYKLIFDRRWIQERFPGFHVQGAVVFKRFDRNDPEGGSSCDSGGPGTNYSWSVAGDTLTLTPAGGTDPCAPRGFLWTGDWTRVP
jgi:hypothetical protein